MWPFKEMEEKKTPLVWTIANAKLEGFREEYVAGPILIAKERLFPEDIPLIFPSRAAICVFLLDHEQEITQKFPKLRLSSTVRAYQHDRFFEKIKAMEPVI